MLNHDLPYYKKLSQELDAIRREMRQNIPMLKLQDDIMEKVKKDIERMNEMQDKAIAEAIKSINSNEPRVMQGLYPMIEKASFEDKYVGGCDPIGDTPTINFGYYDPYRHNEALCTMKMGLSSNKPNTHDNDLVQISREEANYIKHFQTRNGEFVTMKKNYDKYEKK